MDEQQKLNEFEPATHDAWLKLVERDLQGAPFEKKLVKRIAGVDVQPLYTKADAAEGAQELPGFAPYTRGSYALGAVEMGWDVRQEVANGEPARAARAVLDALNGGASSLVLTFDDATRTLSDAHGVGGISLQAVHDLATVLEHADLEKTPIQLKAGASSFAAAAGLVALAKQRGARASALAGCLGLDPLASLAREGALPGSLANAYDQAAELAQWAAREAKSLRTLSVDTAAYHDAGADAALEIAIALATGVEYLRALTERGLDVDSALSQLQFGFSVGRDFFLEIAKLRAARRTWALVAKSCGASSGHDSMVIHATTSLRTKTQRDPWVNLLRGTAESFSAAVAGADAITTHGFDVALGESDEFAERMARNTQHLLRHESNLHRVVDPAGGSWYVETLTTKLAEQAWSAFQAIEREGGLAKALASGSVQSKLKALLEQEDKAVETRKIAITGVNEFPHVREESVTRDGADTKALRQRAQEAASVSVKLLADAKLEGQRLASAVELLQKGGSFLAVQRLVTSGDKAQAQKLTQRRLAHAFESLRDQADAYARKKGARPRVFLANLGPIPEHKARATYAQNFFEAGGFEALGNDGFATAEEAAEAFVKSGAESCVLCSSDAVYAELAEATARALAQKGAKAIALAGSAGDKEAAYRAAGVTDFIFVGANLVVTLRGLLARAGVV